MWFMVLKGNVCFPYTDAMAVHNAAHRHFFRFSLRTLFVLVTIVGSILGWIGEQVKRIRDRREALQWIVDYYARSLARDRGSLMPPQKGDYISHAGIKAPWSLDILGEASVERLVVYEDWLNADAPYIFDELKSLFPEANVTVIRPRSVQPSQRERLLAVPLISR